MQALELGLDDVIVGEGPVVSGAQQLAPETPSSASLLRRP